MYADFYFQLNVYQIGYGVCKKPHREKMRLQVSVELFFRTGVRTDADSFTVQRAFGFEFDITVNFGEQSVVFAHTYVVACVEFGLRWRTMMELCGNQLVAVGFNAQAFGF